MSRRRQQVVVPQRSVRVPTPTWTAVKHKVAATEPEGTTLTDVINRLLVEYASS